MLAVLHCLGVVYLSFSRLLSIGIKLNKFLWFPAKDELIIKSLLQSEVNVIFIECFSAQEMSFRKPHCCTYAYHPFKVFSLNSCPGFGQDRVNFHQNPERGIARWADPTLTWPNRAGYSIPCAVTQGSGGGGGAARTHSRLGSGAAAVRSDRLGLFLSCFLLICIVVVPVSLCLLFC